MSAFPCVYTKWQYMYNRFRSSLHHNNGWWTSLCFKRLTTTGWFLLAGPSIIRFTAFATQFTAAMVDSYDSIDCEPCAWK